MKCLFLIALLITSFVVNAGEYTGPAKITKFRNIDGTGLFVIMGEWDKSKADGCSNASKWVVGEHSNYSSPESISSAFSMVLAAYMADKTVDLYIDGCNSANQPKVSAIWLPGR